jgi:hypothetical protein
MKVVRLWPQSGGIERDLDVLRTINRDRNSMLGVAAWLFKPVTSLLATPSNQLVRPTS